MTNREFKELATKAISNVPFDDLDIEEWNIFSEMEINRIEKGERKCVEWFTVLKASLPKGMVLKEMVLRK